MPRKSLREAILDAAERVISRQGLANSTVDAIALEAGVSKGGLFYHFASKKALLLSLLDRYEEHFQAQREQIMASLPDTPSRLLKATIIASIDHPARKPGRVSNLLSLLDDVELREKIADFKTRIVHDVLSASRFPERSALAMLAADGLWVSDIFGKPVLDDKFKKKVISELLRIIDTLEAKT